MKHSIAKTIAISSPLLTRFCLMLSIYDITIHHIHFQIPNWIFCWRGSVLHYQIMTSLYIIFFSKYLIEFFSEQTIAAWPYTYIHSLGTFGQIIPLNDQNKSFVVYCNNRLTPSPLFACHSCLTWHSWSSWTREYCRYLHTVVNINAGHLPVLFKNILCEFVICSIIHYTVMYKLYIIM